MSGMTAYFAGAVVCSAVFTAFYSLLLERKAGFAVCRAWLPWSMKVAAVIPALNIPVWAARTVYVTASEVSVGEITAETVADVSTAVTASHAAVFAVWLAGTLFMLSLTAVQLLKIRRLRRKAVEVDFGEYRLLKVDDAIASFSFFKTIFVSAATDPADLRIIIAHETGHIRRRHSAERMDMELTKAVLWWNPFVWIAARRLTEVQEYEADSYVLDSGYNVTQYINTLLKHLFGYSPDIANGLRDSLTKKRLKMMTKTEKSRYALLRLAAAVPVAGILMSLFSFTAKADNIVVTTPDGEAYPMIVVNGEVWDSAKFKELNAEQIESITIYKDGEQAAAYSSLGDTSAGVVVVTLKPSTDGDTHIYADTMPRFGNGDLTTFRQWVMMNVRFPEKALEKGIAGRVVVSFVVRKDGSVGDIKVLASPDESLSNEVRRVLSMSPRWTPGMNNGETVNIRFTLPVDFAVSSPDGSLKIAESESSDIAADFDKVTVVGFQK